MPGVPSAGAAGRDQHVRPKHELPDVGGAAVQEDVQALDTTPRRALPVVEVGHRMWGRVWGYGGGSMDGRLDGCVLVR